MGDADKLFSDLFANGSATSGGEVVQLSNHGRLHEDEASASNTAPSRQWYVVLDGVQVGPVSRNEMEERWVGREIGEDTLVWRAGMSEWMPLAGVTDLVYLISELPQTRMPPPVPGLARSGARSQADLTPSLYSPARADAINWKPSAAKALATLVELEMGELPEFQPRRLTDEITTGEAAASPGLASVPLFGQASGPAAAGQSLTASGQAHSGDPFAHFAAQRWQVNPTMPTPKGVQPVHLFTVVMLLALLLMAGVVGLTLRQTGSILPAAAKVTVAAPKPAQLNPIPPAPAPPLAVAEPVPVAPVPESKPTPTRSPAPSRTEAKRPTSTPAADRGMDDVFRSQAKPRLQRDDVVDGVRRNRHEVSHCAVRAGRGRELLPGRYNIVLDFRIRANGKISSAQVKGPKTVLGTSIPACFALAMRKWRFPASRNDTPIKNFKFRITVR